MVDRIWNEGQIGLLIFYFILYKKNSTLVDYLKNYNVHLARFQIIQISDHEDNFTHHGIVDWFRGT